MKRLLFALALGFALVGCHHVSEQDLLGTWKADPAAVATNKNPMAGAMTFNLTADHHFLMPLPSNSGIYGTWGFLQNKLTLTPTTFVTPSPFDPSKSYEVPIGPAIDQMQKAHADPEIIKAMQTMSVPIDFEVSSDGKKLTEEGKPAMVKA